LAQPWYGAIVVLVSRATPPQYLEYLMRRGIEHLVTGENRVDLSVALNQLHLRYGVQSIRTDCGGSLNGALLAAGLVDELAVIVNPSVAAIPGSTCFVDLPYAIPAGLRLTLVELEAERQERGARVAGFTGSGSG
jgi:2,5-diamino-6-(ribosylamino)-4(3H)-pyrimidinone 5'-phosphate reductase